MGGEQTLEVRDGLRRQGGAGDHARNLSRTGDSSGRLATALQGISLEGPLERMSLVRIPVRDEPEDSAVEPLYWEVGCLRQRATTSTP